MKTEFYHKQYGKIQKKVKLFLYFPILIMKNSVFHIYTNLYRKIKFGSSKMGQKYEMKHEIILGGETCWEALVNVECNW